MKKMKNQIGIPTIVIGVIISLIVSFILSGILAWTIVGERLPQNSENWAVPGIVFISSFIGLVFATTIQKSGIMIVAGIHLVIYMLVLSGINIMFFQGKFPSFFICLICTLLGDVVVCLIKGIGTRKGTASHRRYR